MYMCLCRMYVYVVNFEGWKSAPSRGFLRSETLKRGMKINAII
jgi:hypothetical protein